MNLKEGGIVPGADSLLEIAPDDRIAEEINSLRGELGTDLLFEVPGMINATADIIADLGTKRRLYVGFLGIPGGGKKELVAALMLAVGRSDYLKEKTEKLEVWNLTFADACMAAYDGGDIPREVPWGRFTPDHASRATQYAMTGVSFLMNPYPSSVTRLVIFSGVGILDHNPLDPNDVIIDENERVVRNKLDLGGGVHQAMASHRDSRVIVVVGGRDIYDNSLRQRAKIELVAENDNDNPDELQRVLAEEGIAIDAEKYTARDLQREGASAFGVSNVYRQVHEVITVLGSKTLGIETDQPLTRETLLVNEPLRRQAVERYALWLTKKLGYGMDKVFVARNYKFVPPPPERKRLRLKKFLDKHKFPKRIVQLPREVSQKKGAREYSP